MEETSEHLNPSDEIALDNIKKRAVRGVVLLTGRTFILSLISLAATAFLTVFLDPKDFGVFWIVAAVVNFLSYFSDVGLAAALIQKKDVPTDSDLKTTFTVQQMMVFAIFLILILATPVLSRIYSLDSSGRLLLYALGLSLIISSLKTIPSVLIERKIEFEKLVIPQIVETLVYNLVVVFLAWKGFGITSFTVAIVLRSITGLIIIYILQPWVPGIFFSKKSFRSLLSYGVPYQANTLLATVKDDGMTAVLGGILGPTGIGYLGWAQKWGQAPLRFFMDHVLKVTFPAFARMQEKKEDLRRSVERSVFFICILVLPSLAGLLVLAPILVQIIPRYSKWSPALIPLMLIGVNTVFAAVTTQLTNLLNAIGKIKTTFKLMIMWTILTWLLVPLLAVKFGVTGAALGYALVGSSSVIAIFIAKKSVNFSLKESVVRPGIAALLMFVVLMVVKRFLLVEFLSVWILILAGVSLYILLMYLLSGPSLVRDIKLSFKTLFSKAA